MSDDELNPNPFPRDLENRKSLDAGVETPIRQRDEPAKLSILKTMTVFSIVLERTLQITKVIWKLSLIAMIPYGISLLSSLNQTCAALQPTLKSIVEELSLKAIRLEPDVLPTLAEPSLPPSIKGSGKKR